MQGRKMGQKEKHLESLQDAWWLRGPDLNQRPSGYELRFVHFITFCSVLYKTIKRHFAFSAI
jgi:hypothetical protein